MQAAGGIAEGAGERVVGTIPKPTSLETSTTGTVIVPTVAIRSALSAARSASAISGC